MNKLPALEYLLNYKNPVVIKRFKYNFPELQDKAETIFIDLLKYLWLCNMYEQDIISNTNHPSLDFTCVMHREMAIIDEMWHTFILITQDYAEFCQHYFGKFLHHVPEVGEEVVKNGLIDKTIFQKELTLFLSYVYDHLGEETVRSWFSIYLTGPE